MDHSMLDQVRAVWKLSRRDQKCREIGERYDTLETAFSEMVAKLSQQEQDIAWGFVCVSDELDCRVMELMCECFDLDPIRYLEELERGENGGGDSRAGLAPQCCAACSRPKGGF